MFLHPHAHRFSIVVVAFVRLNRKAASNVTDVLLRNKKVPGELFASLADLHEALPMFGHYLGDRQAQSEMVHDEFTNMC
jgi:hypothetical protein